MIYKIDYETGKVLGKLKLSHNINSPFALEHDSIYYRSGDIYVIEKFN